MPDIMQDFKHLETFSDAALFERQTVLKNSSGGNMEALSDDALQELLAIARVLRRRTTAPKAKSSSRAAAPTLDAL